MPTPWIRSGFSLEADLVVVGAGIVGLWTALLYQRRNPDHRVVVLERAGRPDGASVRNAGFACFGSPSELLADMATEGEAAALHRVEERWKGLQEMRQELGDAHIGFEASGGYELFADIGRYTAVAEGFDRLNDLLKGIFGRQVYSWQDERIPELGLGTDHLCFTDLEGAVDSGRLMRTLLGKARHAGVDIFFGVEVNRVHEQNDHAELSTNAGAPVRSRNVVVAINGYTRTLLPELDVLPARGQVLLTTPIAGLGLKGTFHADEGYFYFRDLHGAVLLGGGRHLDKAGETTDKEGTTQLIQDHLEDLLRRVVLPGRDFTVLQRWSGIMGFGQEGKAPLVARISPSVGVAARLSGMGVAIGIRVARGMVDLLEANPRE